MRVAMVLGASAGGIGRHVGGVVPRLVGRGHQVQIFCPSETAAHHGLDRLGVPVRPLRQLTRARSADVLHAHGYKAIAAAGTVARPFGPPLVGSWHNEILAAGWPGRAGRQLQRYAVQVADLTLAASDDLVRRARELGGAARFSPVAAPALPRPSADRPSLRERLGLTDQAMVLSVGRLASQKNYPMLLEIAGLLSSEPVEFWVVGDGPLRAELQTRIDTEGLALRLLGARDDIADLLSAADLFALTSDWEARALVVQEAMLAGLPVVTTAVGGLPGLVGDDAVLVPAGDAVAAAQAVRTVLQDQSLAARLRAGGLARATRFPNEDTVAADVELAYRTVLL